MTALTFIFSIISPLFVALLRKPLWPKHLVTMLAAAVVTILYVIGLWLDNALVWPLTNDFWVGLAAAFGSQQFAYFFVYQDNDSVKELERF